MRTIEKASGRRAGSPARFFSLPLTESLEQSTCFVFIYHMTIKGDNLSYLDNLMVINDVEKVHKHDFSQGSIITLFILIFFVLLNNCYK